MLRFTFGRPPADELEVSTMAPAANMKNFSDLLAQVPSGAWVAISQDGLRVVAFGPEMRDVIEKVEKLVKTTP